MTFQAIDPATEQPLGRHDATGAEALERALEASRRAFEGWRQRPFSERAAPMRRAGELLRERRDALAELMTSEMGKPIAQARGEVTKCAWVCDHYAERAEVLLTPELVATDASLSMIRHDPLGPVLAIMPWNYPLWQVFRFAAPTLMAGNVGLLKHAPNVPGCALEIAALFADAGMPEGVFQTLLIDTDATAEVIADPRVRAVTLTGSVRAGRAVGALAGQHLKPSVLELGGSDPFVVLPDADLDAAVADAVTARTQNNGQSCIAAKRFIVHDDVHDAFVARLRDALAALKVGDPRADDTDLGPMARADLRDDLHDQVTRSVDAGATLALGGELPGGKGFFYPVTLLTDVVPGHAAFDEETFGPVAAVTRARDTEHAVALANDSVYGLGASLWTRDQRLALSLAPRIAAGNVFVNGFVRSDPRLPFGGIGHSGYGRELSRSGILAFVNQKTVWVA